MSKVKIQGNASGTGVLTIAAPNTSTDRTITLPDSTGTILDENSSLPAANLTGTIADARFPSTLPAISGANLTNLPDIGKVVQMNSKASTATTFNNSSGTVTLDTLAFSNAHTSGNGVFIGYPIQTYTTSASSDDAWLYFKVFDGSTELDSQGRYYWASGAVGYNNMYACCVFPSISSTATLTVKITAATSSSFSQVINGQDNAKGFFIQEIA